MKNSLIKIIFVNPQSYINFILQNTLQIWAGPASTEVEHFLHKIFVQGDRGSNLAEDLSFQTRSITNAINV